MKTTKARAKGTQNIMIMIIIRSQKMDFLHSLRHMDLFTSDKSK